MNYILKLLHSTGFLLFVALVASASAQTVRERSEKEPGFQVYPVIFGVTAATKSKPPVVRLVEVGTPKGAPKIEVPDAFIKAAKKKIQAQPPQAKMKDGKPAEVFTYFFFVPGHPDVVIMDLDKPLDKQP